MEVRPKMSTTENSLKGVSPEMKAASRKQSIKGAEQRFKQAQRASIMLKHVSDPTRLQVVLILSDGEQHVGSLCEQLGQSQPAVSHHLALLRHGGVIVPRRQGKNNFYGLTDKGEDLSRIVKSLIA
jgi:DNA-binding transcriptional ArsR family regulator